MSRTIAALVVVAALVATAAASPRVQRTTEVAAARDAAWTWQHRCASNDEVNLVFAIRQKNTAGFTARLHQIADPTHPDYNELMSFEEVGQWLRDDAALEAVEAFLRPYAIKMDRTLNGDFVTVRMSAEAANRAFEADFHAYKHAETGRTVFRTAAYSLPAEVDAAVDYAARLVDFPARLSPKFTAVMSPEAGKAGDAYPAVIQAYYNFPTTAPTPAGTTAHGALFEALAQDYSPQYLATFQSTYGVATSAAAKSIGPNTPLNCLLQPNDCAEAQLDTEYFTAIAQGLPWWYWSIPSTDQTPFVDWAVAVANTSDAPWVHSISYGGGETGFPSSLLTRFDMEVQKLGARGVSVFVASGDDGVAGSGARTDPSQCGFNPSFPASVPHITSVGATMGPESNSPEVACTSDNGGLITTGGGFSGVFPQPSWQASAVAGYMSSGVSLPPSSMYNGTGRAYPDMAMMGHNYEIYLGQTGVGSGTSASTPVFAAAVALVNNKRVAAGKNTLGFLNPAIYQQAANGTFLHDVTSGTNNCAAGPVNQTDCCQYGFTATTGWDPVTGFGSIDFDKFSSVFASL